MSYAVVIFDKDDSVAVVSKEWLKISKSKTACYWPDVRNPKKWKELSSTMISLRMTGCHTP